MQDPADFDLMSERFFADPHPTLARMRSEAPVYWFAPLRSYFVSRYADIEAAVRDPRLSSRRSTEVLGALGLLGEDEASQKMAQAWSRVVFFQDAPRHTLLRQLIMKGFAPAALEQMRPRIAAVVQKALGKMREAGEADVVADFGEPIAVNSLAELFGLPEADRAQFMRWSTDVIKPSGAAAGTDEAQRTIKQSSNALLDYMTGMVAERRRKPGEDLVSRFLAAEESSPELAGEAALQSFQMVGAGLVTSMNQIANTVLALLKHPEALRQLRLEPTRLRGALEEALRHEPAALSTSRLCVEDTEIGGTPIAKGSFVFFLLAGANRDPAVFSDPDRFDISRSPNRHLTFGAGSHYCPGAPLIRMELEEALRALLALPSWELSGRPYDYQGSNFQDRGPSALHVRFAAASQ